MEYPKLKRLLNDRHLLEEEEKMWLRIGIYITTEPEYDYNNKMQSLKLIDGMGNICLIGTILGMNIRQSILAWWQVEKVKPRATESTDATGLSALENRNG